MNSSSVVSSDDLGGTGRVVASCIGFGNDGRMEVRFSARLGWNLGCFLPQGRGPRGFPLCDSAALGMWTCLVNKDREDVGSGCRSPGHDGCHGITRFRTGCGTREMESVSLEARVV